MATFHVPNTFVKTETDEWVIMVMTGLMVDLLVQTDPGKYAPYVHITKKGENDPLVELDVLSDIDDEAFEAELDLSLEARAKIMKEENDKKVAK